jgi:hypothetical protein
MEIEGASFSECESQLDGGVAWGNATSWNWLAECNPIVGTEEWCSYVGVLKVKDRSREGLKLGGGGRR